MSLHCGAAQFSSISSNACYRIILSLQTTWWRVICGMNLSSIGILFLCLAMKWTPLPLLRLCFVILPPDNVLFQYLLLPWNLLHWMCFIVCTVTEAVKDSFVDNKSRALPPLSLHSHCWDVLTLRHNTFYMSRGLLSATNKTYSGWLHLVKLGL